VSSPNQVSTPPLFAQTPLSGLQPTPADERRRADEQAALVMASSVEIERLGRLITDLEARLGAQQRRLDRRVARTGLKLADSLGRTQRRIRRIRPPQF
jgi:hypothetical protein